MIVSEHAEELRELEEWERPRIEFLDAFLPVPWFADGETGALRWRYCRAISFALYELFEPADPLPIAFLRSLTTTGFNLPIPAFSSEGLRVDPVEPDQLA